jgi:AcrR family transcriptional regulator
MKLSETDSSPEPLDPQPTPFARLDRVPAAQDPVDESVPVRGAGRPLDENVDEAILNGAWQVLLEEGYAAMSIARVAEVARVGRPAIYRRYKDKSELVRAALADKRSRVAPIDTGSARGDLIAHMEFARLRFKVTLAGTVLVDGAKHPEILEYFREGMLVPHVQQMAAAFERGKNRGEVRPDLDTTLAVHALMGSFMFHNLARGAPPKGWAERIVDALWDGFAA